MPKSRTMTNNVALAMFDKHGQCDIATAKTRCRYRRRYRTTSPDEMGDGLSGGPENRFIDIRRRSSGRNLKENFTGFPCILESHGI